MNRFSRTVLIILSVLSANVDVSAQMPPTTVDEALAQAKVAAGTDWAGTFLRLCVPVPASTLGSGARGGQRRPPEKDLWYAKPAKVADNLYFLGTKVHSAWAVVGSEGNILIDALFDYAAKDEILDGMKTMGLDKSRVKYVLLSHAHADHDGGAKLLQDNLPDAHLVYGEEDWEAIDKAQSHAGGKPRRDKVGDDGIIVSVGDASVRVVTMPGHTPGTLSYLFEVRDHGKPMRVAYVGGTAIPFSGSAAFYDRYIASSKKMEKAASEYGTTVLLSNHSEFDNAYFKANVAVNRTGNEANPFEVGADAVDRYFRVVQSCAAAAKMRVAGNNREQRNEHP